MILPCTLGHISDLHISLHHARHNIRNTRRVLEFILRQGVDHIVVTGDIAANGDKHELTAARKIFNAYGLLDSKKMSVVIGNHDIYGGVYAAEDVLTFPSRCKRTKYASKVMEFCDAFGELFENSLHGKPKELFPFAKTLQGVTLFGLNSVAEYSRMRNPIGSNGEINDGQFARLKSLISSELFRNDRKVVLVHHHFNKMVVADAGTMHSVWGAVEKQTMKLRGKKRLLRLFAENSVDLVLHGHVHANGEYVRKGIRFVNTGGSIVSDGSVGPYVTIIRILADGIRTELHRLSHAVGEPVLKPAHAETPEISMDAAA